ncbi:hypothetical protein B0H63DRAFT_121287 [Podospora didyma]|uniref:Uncharacterized protein n=1 Tax=Podospora didyma TaxID=330526 RepID=A0AAE0NZQ8_9PEZI|nr:hypothetical protein B0H63DRAFT_121287 [Podospora didyma]
MSFASEFHVPGAYRFDTTTRSRPALSAGLFRPPVSPSASSYNLAKSTGSLYSDVSMSTNTTPATGTIKRKRVETRESTPVEWNMNMDGANDGREEEKMSSAGRQIRYTLAGQINATPLGAPHGAENGLLEDSVYSDIDYRRALGPKHDCDEMESPSVQLPHSHSFSQPDTSGPSGWSSFALYAIGDVVGKVWEFCKTGTFKGFHAGGGKGYELNGPGMTAQTTGQAWCNEHDLPTLQREDSPFQTPTTGIPGQFPQQDYAPYSSEYQEEVATTPESTPRPAVKRRQVSAANRDDLGKHWVIVDEPREQKREPKPRRFGSEVSQASSRQAALRNRNPMGLGYYSQTAASSGRRISVPISRLSSGGSGAPNLSRNNRASLRISHAGSPNLTAHEPASFAQPRSPALRQTPSRIPIPSQPSPVQPQTPNAFIFPGVTGGGASRPSSRQSLRVQSPAPSLSSPTKTTRGHHRSQSAASAATTARRSTAAKINPEAIQASPRLDAEAKALAQKKLAAERETDARVDFFNASLLRMIQQGKEALGTTVEVLDDDYDGNGMSSAADRWEDDDDEN